MNRVVRLFRQQKDERVVEALCIGLARVPLTPALAAQLFVLGFAVTLFSVCSGFRVDRSDNSESN